MKKNQKNEELQSRREFFKNAAKGALPFLGAVLLANTPLLSHANTSAPMGCGYSCSGGCSTSCSGYCGFGCSGTCKGGCGGCKGACQSSCTHSSFY